MIMIININTWILFKKVGIKLKKEKILAIGLTASMVLQMNVFASSTESFSDLPNDWSRKPLIHAVENGLISGSNGKINGSGKLTRAEMAAIVSRAFGVEDGLSLNGFIDVNEDAWYYKDMAKAVKMEIIQGDNNKLNPEKNITREEAFTILARAFLMENNHGDKLNTFQDGNEVSSWAIDAINALISNGYISGSEGKINPRETITRAEFAKVMENLASTYITSSGTISEVKSGNVIIKSSGVILKDLNIDGDLIFADGVNQDKVVLDNVKVAGRLIIRGGANSSEIKSSKISEGITIKNNNKLTHLIVKDSDIPKIITRTDFAIDGNTDKLEILDQATVTIKSGEVKDIVVDKKSDKTKIIVEKEGYVKNIDDNGNGIKVSGEGRKNSENKIVASKSEDVKNDSKSRSGSGGGRSSSKTSSGSGGSSSGTDDSVNKGGTGNTSGNDNGSNNTGGNSSTETGKDKNKETTDGTDDSVNNGGTGNTSGNDNGSNNTGGNSSTETGKDKNKETTEFLNLDETKVMDLGWVQYTVISFKNGNLNDYKISVNGKEVKASKIDDEGTLAKWEIEKLGEFKLTVEKDGKVQTVVLGGRR